MGATPEAVARVKVVAIAAAYTIYNSQGKVHTGNLQNCKGLSKKDRKTTIATCKKNYSKSSQTESKKYVADNKCQLYELYSNLTEMKACIATFAGKTHRNNSIEFNSSQEAPISGGAGNSFGGCASKLTNT